MIVSKKISENGLSYFIERNSDRSAIASHHSGPHITFFFLIINFALGHCLSLLEISVPTCHYQQ